MFESGVVKFTYFDNDGSNAWLEYTALDYPLLDSAITS